MLVSSSWGPRSYQDGGRDKSHLPHSSSGVSACVSFLRCPLKTLQKCEIALEKLKNDMAVVSGDHGPTLLEGGFMVRGQYC